MAAAGARSRAPRAAAAGQPVAVGSARVREPAAPSAAPPRSATLAAPPVARCAPLPPPVARPRSQTAAAAVARRRARRHGAAAFAPPRPRPSRDARQDRRGRAGGEPGSADQSGPRRQVGEEGRRPQLRARTVGAMRPMRPPVPQAHRVGAQNVPRPTKQLRPHGEKKKHVRAAAGLPVHVAGALAAAAAQSRERRAARVPTRRPRSDRGGARVPGRDLAVAASATRARGAAAGR